MADQKRPNFAAAGGKRPSTPIDPQTLKARFGSAFPRSAATPASSASEGDVRIISADESPSSKRPAPVVPRKTRQTELMDNLLPVIPAALLSGESSERLASSVLSSEETERVERLDLLTKAELVRFHTGMLFALSGSVHRGVCGSVAAMAEVANLRRQLKEAQASAKAGDEERRRLRTEADGYLAKAAKLEASLGELRGANSRLKTRRDEECRAQYDAGYNTGGFEAWAALAWRAQRNGYDANSLDAEAFFAEWKALQASPSSPMEGVATAVPEAMAEAPQVVEAEGAADKIKDQGTPGEGSAP